MTQINRIMDARALEKVMEWESGVVDPITWLVIQECAKHVKAEEIAKGLGVSEEDLDGIAIELTGESAGLDGQAWKNAVMCVRVSMTMNAQMIATGWDGIEAVALQRLSEVLMTQGQNISVKDALEIAQVANRANRRHLGEGVRGGSVSVQMRGGQGDLDMELRGGNLGSIRMSLSHRVQAQMATPRVIDAESRPSREMLNVEDTRKLVDGEPKTA